MNRTIVRHALTCTAVLSLGAAGSAALASPARITPQSIIVNPVDTDLEVSAFVNKNPGGQANPAYAIGEKLTVSVTANQDAYVYLFNVNSDGKIDLFLPNRYEPEANFVKANIVRAFPATGSKYQLTVGGPVGQDKILALASKTRLNLDDIATFSADQGFAEVSVQTQDRLAKALSIVVEPLPQAGWVTDTLLYRVVRGQGGSAQTPPVGDQGGQTPQTTVRPGEREDGSIDEAIATAYDRTRGLESLGTPQDRNRGAYVYRWGNGAAQDFEGVAAYGEGVVLHADGSSRAYAVHGDILTRYLALAESESGGVRPPSRLGWAAGDEKVIPRNPYETSGLYGFFQNGAIYSTEKYGTFVLSGDVLRVYQGLGGSGSFLGFPTRDQYTAAGGRQAAAFEGGTVSWDGTKYRAYRK